MPSDTLALIGPAFVAGLFTFLAPCTLPLLPGFLAFISGATPDDRTDPEKRQYFRVRVFQNALLYVIGFSIVFIGMGVLFGLVGAAFAQYRIWFFRIGGVFVILFGLFMMGALKLPFLKFLNSDVRFHPTNVLTPGKPLSSFIFGATFAFGWTPCVGPILGTILLFASTSGTIVSGGFLLAIFSVGLGIPFLLLALGIGHAAQRIRKITRFLHPISIIGGVFLVVLGIFMVLNKFSLLFGYFYKWFGFLNYEGILEFL